MKLVRNTTDIPSKDIEHMLRELEEPDDLPVAVKVKNCWNSPCFVGYFYPEMTGSITNRNGKVYELGGRKYGCRHVITMRVPWACIPMPARRSGGKRLWIEVPDRVTGLTLLAAHEVEHARRYEAGLDYGNESACDDKKLEMARRLGLRMSGRREELTSDADIV